MPSPDPRPETLDREALRSHGDESPGALARTLRAARKHQGRTLREVERATEIPNAHVSQIERGTIKKPEPETVVRLAQFFGLNEVLLLRWAGHDWFADKLDALLAAEQRAEEAERGLEALFSVIDEWFAGDVPDGIRNDHRWIEAGGIAPHKAAEEENDA